MGQQEKTEISVGKYWETPDGSRRRIYIDEENAWRVLGWDFSFYNTGNISSAWVNGARISNTEGHNLIQGFRLSSLYFDLADRKFHWKQTYNRDFTRDDVVTLVTKIRDEINKMAAKYTTGGES